jgi:hypothetical protein
LVEADWALIFVRTSQIAEVVGIALRSVGRLAQVQSRPKFAIAVKALNELVARRAREEAARDSFDIVAFPEPLARNDGPDFAKTIPANLPQFVIRPAAHEGEKRHSLENAPSKAESSACHAKFI